MAKIIRQLFKTRPVLSNVAVYGCLYVGADFSQQTLSRKLLVPSADARLPYDVGSLSRYAVYGTAFLAPTYFYWYRWLDGRICGTTTRAVAAKLIMDQFLMGPLLVASFFVGLKLLEGNANFMEELKKKWALSFMASCVFWLPTQTINFLFFPPHLRVVYVGSCTFIWVNFLSYMKRKDVAKSQATLNLLMK